MPGAWAAVLCLGSRTPPPPEDAERAWERTTTWMTDEWMGPGRPCHRAWGGGSGAQGERWGKDSITKGHLLGSPHPASPAHQRTPRPHLPSRARPAPFRVCAAPRTEKSHLPGWFWVSQAVGKGVQQCILWEAGMKVQSGQAPSPDEFRLPVLPLRPGSAECHLLLTLYVLTLA